MATVNKIQEPVNREVVNSIKLINFHIDSKMVFHRIRINNENNTITITHYYHVLSDDEYSELESIIKNSDNCSNTSNDYSTQNNYTNEDSVCKIINFNMPNRISINTFKINSCKVRTKTKITAP